MGTDAYARTTVGFPLDPEELWSEEDSPKTSCPKGHPANPNANFCPECGSKYKQTRKRHATEAFDRLCKEEVLGNPEEAYEILIEPYGTKALGFYNVKAFSSSEDREKGVFVLGFMLSETGNWRRGQAASCSVTLEEFSALVAYLSEIRTYLGVEDREIQVYTHMYISI